MLNNFSPVILAGGSGTRFWPRSRRARSKQLLALAGDRSMLQQTVDRLSVLAAFDQIWTVANEQISSMVTSQLPELPSEHLIAEPAARNTAPAAGLMAFILERSDPERVMGVFPSDHVIGDLRSFASAVADGVQIAAAGENIVVLGIQPSRPETGYGYIENDPAQCTLYPACKSKVFAVSRFTEKPDRSVAERFLQTGRYSWNSGMFLWSVRTLCNAYREHVPAMAETLEQIAAAHGTSEFDRVFRELYPLCENISLDFALLEPRSHKANGSNIYCIHADFGWNDLGSWSALHEHRCAFQDDMHPDANVMEDCDSTLIDASGNYVYSPGKHAALVGVHDLVVVVTDDAVLVTTRDRAQDVGLVVKHLQQAGEQQLL